MYAYGQICKCSYRYVYNFIEEFMRQTFCKVVYNNKNDFKRKPGEPSVPEHFMCSLAPFHVILVFSP